MGHVRAAGLMLAALTAALEWIALGYELDLSLTRSFAKGLGWGEALFNFLRYFTIETNLGIAILMTATAIRLARRQPLLPRLCYAAGLVYIGVTCATYEIMLRAQWRPQGLQYLSDMTIHDVVPALTLAFWVLSLGLAARREAGRRDPAWMLLYPMAYFAMTLAAGALGRGYPYSFLDVAKRGYPAVLATAVLFLAIFFALGVMVTVLSRQRSHGRLAHDRAVAEPGQAEPEFADR